MEEQIQYNDTGKCFALHFDIQKHSPFIILNELSNIGDVTFIGTLPYIWLYYDVDKSSLLSTLKNAGIEEFYAETVLYSQVQHSQNFLASWFQEHYSSFISQKLEEASQAQLRQMLANVQKATQELDKKIEQLKQSKENSNSTAKVENKNKSLSTKTGTSVSKTKIKND